MLLLIAVGAAIFGTYWVMKNPQAVDDLGRGLFARSEPTLSAAATPTSITPSASAQPARTSSASPRSCPVRDKSLVNGRIVGGADAKAENWPGFVALRTTKLIEGGKKQYRYFCGGTLIDKQWVITAGHCIEDDGRGHRIGRNGERWVQVGAKLGGPGAAFEVVEQAVDLTDVEGGHVHQVEDIKVHAPFTGVKTGNDIALIKLKTPAVGAVMRLSSARKADPGKKNGTLLWVAGFGLTDNETGATWSNTSDGNSALAGSRVLQEVMLPHYAEEACKKRATELYNSAIIAGQICAGYTDATKKDSCGGDSGGPLIRTGADGCPILLGVVSYGTAVCARENAPSVYTRVSAYIDWIRQQAPGIKLSEVTDEGDLVPLEPLNETLLAKRSLSEEPTGAKVKVELLPPGDVKFNDQRQVRVTANGISGYVIVIDVDSAGTLAYLVPNGDEKIEQTKINSGETKTFGEGKGPRHIKFVAGPPAGAGRVVVIVSPDKTLWDRLQQVLTVRDPQGASRGFFVEETGGESGNSTESLIDITQSLKENYAIGEAAYTIVDK
jgi:secreted trypsin-like serine protease